MVTRVLVVAAFTGIMYLFGQWWAPIADAIPDDWGNILIGVIIGYFVCYFLEARSPQRQLRAQREALGIYRNGRASEQSAKNPPSRIPGP